MPILETVIIGGGISGLACARRLHDAGREFLLITDRLGGRMFAGPQPMHNFGAAYVTADYHNVLRFVEKGPRLHRRDAYYHNSDRNPVISLAEVLRYPRTLVRVLARLIDIRAALNRLRAAGPYVCQAEWLRRDPLLDRTIKQPALEFVRANRLTGFTEHFIDPVVTATVFAPPELVNTFYYLSSLFPCLVPTYTADLSRTVDRLTSGYGDRILVDRALAIEQAGGDAWRIDTASRGLEARNVVIATPDRNTRCFFRDLDHDPAPGLLDIAIFTLHVQGLRRPEYKPGKVVYLGPGKMIAALLPAGLHFDIVHSQTPEPDLSPYYEQYTIVGCAGWKTAVQLVSSSWRPLTPRPGLFTIGDYNICGLEDSFITGLFAANRIMGA